MAQIGALLVEVGEGKIGFREGSALALDEALAGLGALEPAAGIDALGAILGLELVMRDRGCPEPADQLNAAIRRVPEAVKILIAMEEKKTAASASAARLLDREASKQAPRLDAPAPTGALKAGSFGAGELDRRRAGAGK